MLVYQDAYLTAISAGYSVAVACTLAMVTYRIALPPKPLVSVTP